MNLGSISTSTAAGESRRSSTSGADQTKKNIDEIHGNAKENEATAEKNAAAAADRGEPDKSSEMGRPGQ